MRPHEEIEARINVRLDRLEQAVGIGPLRGGSDAVREAMAGLRASADPASTAVHADLADLRDRALFGVGAAIRCHGVPGYVVDASSPGWRIVDLVNGNKASVPVSAIQPMYAGIAGCEAKEAAPDDECRTLPPVEWRDKHVHCWLTAERASYPSVAEWLRGAWHSPDNDEPISPEEMWRRGWRFGEVAWPSAKIEDDRRPEAPDPAEPTDEMLTNLATCFFAEWYGCSFDQAQTSIEAAPGEIARLCRRLAIRAFEHAPYLVPPAPRSPWQPIETIGECKTKRALLSGPRDSGYYPAVWSSEGIRLNPAVMPPHFTHWQPIEPPEGV